MVNREDQLKVLCPIHEEKTASFVADNKKGTWLYKCYGCGAGGSVIDLAIHDLGGASKMNAIRHVADIVGFTLPDLDKPSTPEQRAMQNRKRRAIEKERQLKIEESNRQQTIQKYLEENRMELLEPFMSECWRAELYHYDLGTGSRLELRSQSGLADARSFITTLFEPDDILWCGDVGDSGKPEHKAHFKSRDEWLKLAELPPRIAPSTFKPDTFQRSKQRVLQNKFIIIEGDELIGKKAETDDEREENLSLNSALIRFCSEKLGMKLRAVISTGNKSLHGWFERPEEEDFKQLIGMAEGLGIDPATLTNLTSPLRLPHCIHEKTEIRAELHLLNLPTK